jgi:bis(5'-nucleosyl)-tetraphosphatase (symmetrical)
VKTLAVGDIQGCYDEFRELLAVMEYREDEDRLWLVGDLINRGPDNVATMDYVMSLPDAIVVLGNHDLHFLAVARGIRKETRGDTLGDLLASPRLDDMVDWLRNRPLIHVDRTLGYVLVHAGLPPAWTLEVCVARASEVEAVLRSDNYVDFLAHMYGNLPDSWRDDLTGYDRLRIITNYLTRLRYCTAAGTMEFSHKANVQPEGFEPWFRIPRPQHEDFKVLFGHWAALGGHTGNPNIIALDTGCVWGRTLTGIRLDDGKRFSVPSQNQ